MGSVRCGVPAPVCLVNIPRGREAYPSVPLGLLCLKAALERASLPTLILDFELLYRRGDLPRNGDDLLPVMVRRAAGTAARIFGVTTDCSSYPAILRFCRLLKEARPQAVIVLGGAHASFVPRETLAAFPEVDAVVVGEAEQSFPELVAALQAGEAPGGIAGVVYRDGNLIVATPPRPPVMDLESLPRPDFTAYPVGELKELFVSPGPCPFLPVEAGRGCPKACSFCSTSRLWGRHRTKPPKAVVEEMAALQRSYGIDTFELIHDNIASDGGFLPAFCDILTGTGAPFSWSCSISTDLLDGPLAERMARAGCMGIFMGIESASPRTQQSIGKRLDLVRAESMVRECLGRGMSVAAGFVIGFPGETVEELDLTLSMAARLRRAGAEIRLSQLSLLPGTPLCRRHLGEAALGDRYSITSGPLLSFDGQREMIARHPEIFSSFYTLPNRLWTGIDLGWMILFFHSVLLYFPQPLANVLEAAATVGDGPVALFRCWDLWRRQRHPDAACTTEFVFYSFNDYLDHYDSGLSRRREAGVGSADPD
jgi:radical SAM superfamily enzyme YgiQ (UPF0313 family)